MNRMSAGVLLLLIGLVSCGPNLPDADQVGRYSQAKSLYLKGEWKESLAVLRPLVKQNPDFEAARFLAGKIDYLNSDWPQAEQEFSAILDRDPAHADARLWRSRTAIASGKAELAQSDLEWLLAHNAENPQVTLLAASLAEIGGRYQDALEQYRATLLFRDELGKALLNTARLYKRSLQTSQALEQVKQAKQVLAPDSYLVRSVDDLIKELTP